MIVLGGCIGDDAVCGRENLQIPHVRIIGGEEHADIASDAGHDDASNLQRPQQRVERRVEETRVLRLQNEIVALGRA